MTAGNIPTEIYLLVIKANFFLDKVSVNFPVFHFVDISFIAKARFLSHKIRSSQKQME